MKMRKTMWAVCLAALMPISAEAVAATSYDEPQQKENTQKKEIPNLWGIERSGFFNGREKWAKDFENQRV